MIRMMDCNRLQGKFIVLDGPDGCGKSTQVRLLSEVISGCGFEHITLCDPGGSDIGRQIRAILLDNANVAMSWRCESLLYMASRAQLYSQRIAPALAERRCVICDRWLSSTCAYQGVAGGLGDAFVLELANIALERPWPDLTIIIDLPCDQGLLRLGDTPDRVESRSIDYHRKVREGFLSLAGDRGDFCVVDGAGSIDQVHQRICRVIQEYDF